MRLLHLLVIRSTKSHLNTRWKQRLRIKYRSFEFSSKQYHDFLFFFAIIKSELWDIISDINIDLCKQRKEYGEKTTHVLTETWGLLSLEVYLKDLAVLNVYAKVFLLPCLDCYWICQQSNALFHLKGIHWAVIS